MLQITVFDQDEGELYRWTLPATPKWKRFLEETVGEFEPLIPGEVYTLEPADLSEIGQSLAESAAAGASQSILGYLGVDYVPRGGRLETIPENPVKEDVKTAKMLRKLDSFSPDIPWGRMEFVLQEFQ